MTGSTRGITVWFLSVARRFFLFQKHPD